MSQIKEHATRTSAHWPACPIAMVAALVPALLFPVTYLIAASLGHVDWCIPVLSGCTDITHTGLRYPESHLFRVMLGVSSLAIAATWALACEWMRLQAGEVTPRDRRFRSLGVTAGLALFVGTTVLQGSENTLWSVHGLGANLYFLFGYIAVVIFTRRLREYDGTGGLTSERSLRVKILIMRAMTAMLVLVILFRVLGWREGRRVIQWLAAYAYLVYYYTLAMDWRGRLYIRWRSVLNTDRDPDNPTNREN